MHHRHAEKATVTRDRPIPTKLGTEWRLTSGGASSAFRLWVSGCNGSQTAFHKWQKSATTGHSTRPPESLTIGISVAQLESTELAIISFSPTHRRTNRVRMRPELRDPVDQDKLHQLLPLTTAVFDLHERGSDYVEELKQISRLLGRVVGQIDVLGAFGSTDADGFAMRLAIDWHDTPMDLSEPELLELLDAVCEARGNDDLIEYWVRCLALNTGDSRISDLIFWPADYFGAGYDGRELTPTEMLDVALRKHRTEGSQ